MSFSRLSLVSPTTGLTETTSSLPGWARVQAMIASAAWGTARVLVSTIGVSISPSSTSCVLPISLPKPLPTARPAGTRSW